MHIPPDDNTSIYLQKIPPEHVVNYNIRTCRTRFHLLQVSFRGYWEKSWPARVSYVHYRWLGFHRQDDEHASSPRCWTAHPSGLATWRRTRLFEWCSFCRCYLVSENSCPECLGCLRTWRLNVYRHALVNTGFVVDLVFFIAMSWFWPVVEPEQRCAWHINTKVATDVKSPTGELQTSINEIRTP